MGIEALYAVRRTTKPEAPATRLPVSAARDGGHTAKQVWAMDITTSDGAGLCLLAVVLDWFSRRVLVVAVVDHGGGGICVERWRMPWLVTATDIFNTVRVRSSRVGLHRRAGLTTTIAISMDGKGLGGTMCSSSGCGAASNTRSFI